jgi:hypothetical protein
MRKKREAAEDDVSAGEVGQDTKDDFERLFPEVAARRRELEEARRRLQEAERRAEEAQRRAEAAQARGEAERDRLSLYNQALVETRRNPLYAWVEILGTRTSRCHFGFANTW